MGCIIAHVTSQNSKDSERVLCMGSACGELGKWYDDFTRLLSADANLALISFVCLSFVSPEIWVHVAGGPFAAAVASFNVTADKEGSIALTWTASVDQAIVGGLELYHGGEGPLPSPPADVREITVPPAAAPSYSPLAYSAFDLQAPAPGPLHSTGQPRTPSDTIPHCPAFDHAAQRSVREVSSTLQWQAYTAIQ